VLVDLKLFFKAELRAIARQTGELVTVLLALSEKYKAIGMPGYTHYQVAMPSSFGLWLGAYAESLTEDLLFVEAAYRLADKNPLGSAAGFGSSFPIDRKQTTALLGFGDLHWNALNAQMSRGKTERAVATALAAVGATMARLAGDIVLYASQNYGFLTLPAYLSTGSSIMPHKKNPDVFELLRARGNRLQALPNTIALVQANLPSGYHRDFQVLKENVFPALTDMLECLAMMTWALPKLEPVEGILDQSIYKYIGTVEEVNRLVLSGLPFRTAYQQVAAAVEAGTYQPETRPPHTHQGSLDNLSNAQIAKKLAARLAAFD
jgi:argininosuccinate lyase